MAGPALRVERLLGEDGLHVVYLDDRSGYVRDPGALAVVLGEWRTFAAISGMELNGAKTQIWGRNRGAEQALQAAGYITVESGV
eukprot:9704203-Alexandrium_andersonii.AAC.1